MSNKLDALKVDYTRYTALRKLAIEQYDNRNLTPKRLAYLLNTDIDALPSAIRVVEIVYALHNGTGKMCKGIAKEGCIDPDVAYANKIIEEARR